MTIDPPALNESQAQARVSLALLCHQMLNGELSFFEGAIQVCALRSSVGLPEFDTDLLAFVAIASETDHLPPSHIQHRWSNAALDRLQPEFERTETWARGFASQACQNIVERFSPQ
jgi:Protein of unknown function (DUF2489)